MDQLFLDLQAALAGRYSLERELGRGGMGVVFLAREVSLDRLVAIKVLPPARAREAKLRERFLREARTAAKLSHPNIIPIFSVEEVGPFVFFAMAYVDGETLTDRVRQRGPLPHAEAARVLRDVAWALGHAHERHVIHRDVKPDNVLLERASGRALVADFGIAGVVKEAGAIDGGEVIGTPEFMSPEQAVGERVDPRSDLYSLGLVGYFTLTGRLAYTGDKATEVLAKQITEPPPEFDSGSGVPRRLVATLSACLAKDREERPPSAAVVADGLSLVIESRRELPVALRVFVKRSGRLGGTGGLVYLLMVPIAMVVAASLAPRGLQATVAWVTLGAGVVLGPFGMLVARARRFLASGFDPQDLPAAFRIELEQGRDERVFEYGRTAGLYERVMRLLSAGSIASVATAIWVAFTAHYPYDVGTALAVAAYSGVAALTTSFLWLTRLNRRIDLDTRIWRWVWRGPVGKALFALARPFVNQKTLPSVGTHRATELALSLAAGQLFEALPRATRAALKDLPDVVDRLESDASRMRQRLDLFNDALGPEAQGPGTGEDDLRQARELVRTRLKDAVAALETIRLNLLKLHAGTGSVESVTTDLGLAREVAAEVDRLLEARNELDAH
ncbi:MAG TPA: serine/threonine-protein kinase [Gemmatimonadales bacterium]|nr:serine/threonine-protein kinase [Gemmatimonadales bacterium]